MKPSQQLALKEEEPFQKLSESGTVGRLKHRSLVLGLHNALESQGKQVLVFNPKTMNPHILAQYILDEKMSTDCVLMICDAPHQ